MNFFELSRIYRELPEDKKATLIALAQALVPKKNQHESSLERSAKLYHFRQRKQKTNDLRCK